MFDESDLIHSYTRRQAIEDGVLVDAPEELARQAGFRCSIALTAAAWSEAVEWSVEDERSQGAGQDEAGRLWDVLWMARCEAARHPDASTTTFTVLRVPRGQGAVAEACSLVLHIGGGENGEAVATVLLPGED